MNKETLFQKLSDMLSNRCTPENITSLQPNEVFVFGSKPNGHHKSGAAKIAKEKFGAIDGVGEGFNGNSYAIEVHKRHLKKMAVAVGNILKMREEIEDFVNVFKNDILSVDSFGDDFVVLLSDKQVVQLHGDVEIELFKGIRAKSIACGFGGIYALDENGFVHAEKMVNNLTILNGLKTWDNIKQISAGPNIIAGVTQGGKVLMFSMSNLLEPEYIPGNYRNMSNHFTEIPWTSLDGWTDVVKVFVTKDLDEDQPNVVYGITRSGKILIGGRVWFDKYEYYKEMVSLRNVTDIIEDGMTTLVRFNDGKIKLCCYHSEMYYEEQLAFLKKHHSIKDISMKGKFNFVAIDKDEKIYLMYGYQEQDWEYWGY